MIKAKREFKDLKVLDEIYQGKVKILKRTNYPDVIVQEFTDKITAFNGKKVETIPQKGMINNYISSLAFEFLESKGIPTHYIAKLSASEMLVKKVRVIPLKVMVRNIASGSITRRLGLSSGTILYPPVLEFYLKDSELGNPFINEDHIRSLNLLKPSQIKKIKRIALKANKLLKNFFVKRGLLLVDVKFEFGVYKNKKILLADEISPDTCRLWDVSSRQVLDRDRFRLELGRVRQAYVEVYRRLGGEEISS